MGGGRRPEREEKKGCVQGATEIYESRERERAFGVCSYIERGRESFFLSLPIHSPTLFLYTKHVTREKKKEMGGVQQSLPPPLKKKTNERKSLNIL